MRKITVVSEMAQARYELETDVKTLGELKAKLREMNVPFNDDDVFREGRSKTVLATDESILPSNLPWKGGITDDLVFRITVPHKKLNSGADRKALYEEIKSLGLAEECKKKYGKNFTQCSSDLLEALIETAKDSEKNVQKKNLKKVENKKFEDTILSDTADYVRELREKNLITEQVKDNILAVLAGKESEDIEQALSDKEIDDMFKDWDY